MGAIVKPRNVVMERNNVENGLGEEWSAIDQEARKWMIRCRIISGLSLILYIVVIVLAIVYGR